MSELPYAVEKAGILPYLLAVPHGGNALRPVLCFLHGYDEGAPAQIEEALTRHGPLKPGNPSILLESFIVVAPQMPVRGDLWQLHADQVLEIVAQVRRRCGGDPCRTYLTGFSFGANGVFDLVLHQPEEWAALWAVDPTRVPVCDSGHPIWLSIGILARSRTNDFRTTLKLNAFQKNSEQDRILMDEGADHVGSATLAYRDERIYSWLLSKRSNR